MKLQKSLLMLLLVASVAQVQADEGFFGWLSDVTHSTWESVKNTTRSIFGYDKAEEKREEKKAEPIAEKPAENVPAKK